MTRPARRYDIYLPITDNEGHRLRDELFDSVEKRLLGRFHGFTSQQRKFPLRGTWKGETTVYVDQVVVLTVLDFRPRGSLRFIAKLKKALVLEFDQLEILITESPLRVH
jgi:hypothetical protein